MWGGVTCRGSVVQSKAVSSHTPDLECCGWTQLWMWGGVSCRGCVAQSKAVSSHRTPDLECCGWTQLWMMGRCRLPGLCRSIQSGVEPPHSKFGVLRVDAALDCDPLPTCMIKDCPRRISV